MASRTVLLGWSGPLARRVASALYAELPALLPTCRFHMSEAIRPGKPWMPPMMNAAAKADIAVPCVTRLHPCGVYSAFEVGMITGRQLGLSGCFACVMPYAINMGSGQLVDPLRSFNVLHADEPGTWRLVYELARQSGCSTVALQRAFAKVWPRLQAAIARAIDMGDSSDHAMEGKYFYESESTDLPAHRWAGMLTLLNSDAGNPGWRIEGQRTREQTSPRSGYQKLQKPIAWETTWMIVADDAIVFHYYIELRKRIMCGVVWGKIVRRVGDRPVEIDAQIIHLPQNERSHLRMWRAA